MRILITWFFGYCDEFDVWEYGGSFSLLKHEFGGSLWDSGVTISASFYVLVLSFFFRFRYFFFLCFNHSMSLLPLRKISSLVPMLQFFLLLVDQVIGCVTYFLNFWIQISDARKSKIFLFFLSELGCGFWKQKNKNSFPFDGKMQTGDFLNDFGTLISTAKDRAEFCAGFRCSSMDFLVGTLTR
ncbi:hypothetical protein RIR_jg39521.t1 [Rhizophagus irregularis DAOM 181602=DAOM 197198]|nr:hypothetical protein RIR_jg39521.t1 [Rhizophagus irregularis DAOM 181602=DAOM 197198]